MRRNILFFGWINYENMPLEIKRKNWEWNYSIRECCQFLALFSFFLQDTTPDQLLTIFKFPLFIIIDLKQMMKENSLESQHPYIVPLSLQILPHLNLNPLVYPQQSQKYYTFTFFPTFYSPPPQPYTHLLPNHSHLNCQQPTPIHASTESIDSNKHKERQENTFKKLDKKISVEERLFCNCSKNGCLKQYCRCFRSGKVCNDSCNCLECRNSEKQIFAGRKKQKGKKAKCNCRKTRCSSKYCDCLAAGGKCGQDCSCVNCQNQ